MQTQEKNFLDTPQNTSGIGRRDFLKYGGMGLAATLLVGSATGCKKNDNSGINLGSGDFGVLNYAYALEQLEAAFYTQVIATPYSGINTLELSLLTDIMNHEVIHRDFLKAALSSNAIPDLSVNFTAIDFTSRAAVLGAAKTFEDLGVSAYNYAGQLITSADYLLIAGKIVSVEARHAATIRDLLNPLSADFAGSDVIDSNGLDQANSPSYVLSKASAYLKSSLNASNLPTS
jgi:hypothetical protein